MKNSILFLLLCISQTGFTQKSLPEFLAGTWKMENGEVWEHWDMLNKNTLKGVSYQVKNGQMMISEYLDIARKENEIIYTAAVLNQNQGKGIDFKLTGTDSTYTFENPDHDFPKKIVYRKLNDTEIHVQVSDGQQKGFSYKMVKQALSKAVKDSTVANPDYDAALAGKLGGDDYGMKSYILVILKTGSNLSADKTFISNTFRGHLDNINRLVEQKKLIVAGPLGKNEQNYRGIFILSNVASPEEAKELLQTDPAIKAGLLDVELYKWYGSAALPLYLEYSNKIWKVTP